MWRRLRAWLGRSGRGAPSSGGRHARTDALPGPRPDGVETPARLAASDAAPPAAAVPAAAPPPPQRPVPPEPSLQPSVAEVVAVATTGADSPTPGERVPPGTPPAPAGAGVRLGFADGAHVELAPDDPRLAGFRAAAQALLDGRGP